MKKALIILILILTLMIPSSIAALADATVLLSFRQLDSTYWQNIYYHPTVGDYWIIPDLLFDYHFYLTFDFTGYAYYDILHQFTYTYYIPSGYSIDTIPKPVILDYCMFECGEDWGPGSRFDFDINSYEYEEGVSCGIPNLEDWGSGTILHSACDHVAKAFCWFGLNPKYTEIDDVKDYYNWTDIYDIDLNDVINEGFTRDCIIDERESMGCVVSQQVYYTIPLENCTILPNHGLTLTNGEYMNPPAPRSNSSMTNYSYEQSDRDDMPDGGGNAPGESGTIGGGLSMGRIVGLELDKSNIRQSLKWMDTLIDMVKIIFSFVLIFFYILQLLIIGYIMSQLIPGIFRKLQDIVKKGLFMRRREVV